MGTKYVMEQCLRGHNGHKRTHEKITNMAKAKGTKKEKGKIGKNG